MLSAVADASVKLSDAVRNAPLRNLTGAMDATNVQGEIVQKLDDYSNQVLMDYCKSSSACAGYLSEENEGVTTMNETGSLVIAVDPLDGSSNIDIAAPTIFLSFFKIYLILSVLYCSFYYQYSFYYLLYFYEIEYFYVNLELLIIFYYLVEYSFYLLKKLLLIILDLLFIL